MREVERVPSVARAFNRSELDLQNGGESPPANNPYILDGLLMNETGRRVREQYADTGGFADHGFAACSILGYAFVPRIRDLPSKRLSTSRPWPAVPSQVGLDTGARRLGVARARARTAGGAHFVNRLLPDRTFTRMLRHARPEPERVHRVGRATLFEVMATGRPERPSERPAVCGDSRAVIPQGTPSSGTHLFLRFSGEL